MASKSKLELAVDTGQWDAGLRKAQASMKAFENSIGGLEKATSAEKAQMTKFIQLLGNTKSTAATASQQVKEYRSTIERLQIISEKLNGEQKKLAEESMAKLTRQMQEAKQKADQLNKSMGDTATGTNTASIGIKDIEGALIKAGVPVGGFTSQAQSMYSLLSKIPGATNPVVLGIAAVGTASVLAAKQLADYNAELTKLSQQTTVTTGLDGFQADEMRNGIKALADTYNVDFREALNAANTLMTQFGMNSHDALAMVADGLQGMVDGDGAKMLSMIQQFGPAFKDMGIEADQLVAIIHNTEGGIFTDQGMQSIQMAGKKLREMSSATSKSLQAIGIDSEAMAMAMRNGSMTTLQALQQVSAKIGELNPQSQEVGAVLTDVFGRQGSAAGAKMIESIATLNTNLAETKTQTGELGNMTAQLAQKHQELNRLVSEFFESDRMGTLSQEWEAFYTDCLIKIMEALQAFKPVYDQIASAGIGLWDGASDLVYTFIRAISDVLDIMGTISLGFHQAGEGAVSLGDIISTSMKVATVPLKILTEALDWIVILCHNIRDAWTDFKDSVSSTFDFGIIDSLSNKLEGISDWIHGIRNDYQKMKAEMSGKASEDTGASAGADLGGLESLHNPVSAPAAANLGSIIQSRPNAPTKPTSRNRSSASSATTPDYVAGSVAALEKELQGLRTAQKNLATDSDSWKDYENNIQRVNAQIEFLKTGILQLPTIKPQFDKSASDELKRDIQSAGIFTTNSLSALKTDYQNTANNAQIGSRQQTDATAMVADITAFENVRAQFQELGMEMGSDVMQGLLEQIGSGQGVTDEAWQALIDEINAKRDEMDLEPITLDIKTGSIENVARVAKDTNAAWQAAATAISNAGSAMNNLEDPSAKVAGIVMQAIANVALGFAQASASKATGAAGVWGWIAAATAGVATMTATIAQIKSVTKYADGGLVKGSSYTADKVPAMLNAGEIVLSASMQQNLASNMEARNIGSSGKSIITGEQLVTVINAYGRRTQKGEILS